MLGRGESRNPTFRLWLKTLSLGRRPTQQTPMDNDLDRSLAKTGLSKIETPRDSIECEIATIGTPCPTEIGKPVAMADVAESSGPAGTGAGGPVVAGTQFPAVADRTGASGPRESKTGSPVMTGMRFWPAIPARY